jgi:hypothetical protein
MEAGLPLVEWETTDGRIGSAVAKTKGNRVFSDKNSEFRPFILNFIGLAGSSPTGC